MPGIYLIQDGDRLVRMDPEAYDSETVLQTLLAQYPDLLAGDQIDSTEPRRWLLVRREAPIPVSEGGYFALDHLFLDQDGVPTLVEVKRSSDSRLRREVVGQMLDYAANAVAYWPADRLAASFEERCQAEELDPEEAFREALGEELDYDEFWQQVKTNLLAKRIRLLFVADRIPPELRRVVEFLNETMDPVEVLAIEIVQYGGGQQRALVPRVIGQTAQAEQTKRPTPRTKTDRDTFLGTWESPQRERFERLLQLAEREQLYVYWGDKGFSLNVLLGTHRISFFQGYPPHTYSPGLLVVFNSMQKQIDDSEAIVQWYRGELEKLPAVSPTGKGLRCDITALDEAQEERLHAVLAGVAQRIREHGLAQ